MSNFRLMDPDLILIHIPKTGGSTIRNAIWEKSYEGPEQGGFRPEWEGILKVAIVRHPFDRLASGYRDFSQLRGYRKGFSAFLETVCDESIPFVERGQSEQVNIRHHMLPQTHPFYCLEHADIVARFENYEAEVRRILALVGRDIGPLPHRRRTRDAPWHELLAEPGLRDMAAAFLAEDFRQLGYSADGPIP